MTAKEYLSQAYKLDKRIDSKLSEIRRLRELATRATSTFTAGRIGGTGYKSNVENAVAKIVDLEREINGDIDKLLDLKREIGRTIDRLANVDYRNLLRLRYLCGRKWEEIAVELSYSWKHVHKIHSKALLEVKVDTQ